MDEATSGLDPIVRDEILDEFLGFIQDDDHAILISSHITSDLEKAADYITYIHQGQVVLSDAKDRILDNYGRLACTAAQLNSVAPDDLIRVRRSSYGCEGLVADRPPSAAGIQNCWWSGPRWKTSCYSSQRGKHNDRTGSKRYARDAEDP